MSRRPIFLAHGGIRAWSILAVAGFSVISAAGHATPPKSGDATSKAHIAAGYGKLPLGFEANHGQTDKRVKFLARGQGYGLFLTGKGAVLSLSKPLDGQNDSHPGPLKSIRQHPQPQLADVVRMELPGAHTASAITGEEQLPGKVNYFIGNDPGKWHSRIETYAKVKYAGVYPGVDLVYYGNQQQLEYDFVVAPGASARPIRLHFDGAKQLKLDADGDLRVIGRNGEIAFRKPIVYQQSGEQRRPVEGGFTLLAANTVRFRLGSYDRSQPLIIDPVLAYSTYLGGSNSDYVRAIAIDASGNAYVTGSSYSFDFPVTPGAIQSTNKDNPEYNEQSGFVAKLNPDGSALIYSTYLGGNEVDFGTGIAVNASGNAYVTGYTGSSNFPVTSGAYQTHNAAAAAGFAIAFVTELSGDGTALVYSTFIGGTVIAYPSGIALDSAGNAYIAGDASSESGYPTTPGAFQRGWKDSIQSGFVTKLNSQGTALVFSTLLGGNTEDAITSITINGSGNAFVAGTTRSTDFPVTPGAFQGADNNANKTLNFTSFVAEFNTTGTALVYSTYLGGSVSDSAKAIAVDSSGSAYVVGETSSPDFPITPGAFQVSGTTTATTYTGFVTRLDSTGTGLAYSTFLGGSSGSQGAYAIAIDGAGDAYVTGQTESTDFPVTSNALQLTKKNPSGDSTGFVTELDSSGNALIYSTYLGGSGAGWDDTPDPIAPAVPAAIALSPSGDAFVAGGTASLDFPVTPGAFQTTNHASATGIYRNTTGFVTKLSLGSLTEPQTPTPTFSLAGGPYDSAQQVTITDSIAAATIYYTTDNTTPTINSPVYSNPITISATSTLQAIAQAPGDTESAAARATYNLYAANPVLSLASGVYAPPQSVTITDATPGADIFYTLDGSIASAASNPYSTAIPITASGTLNAIAILAGYANSAIVSASYTIQVSDKTTLTVTNTSGSPVSTVAAGTVVVLTAAVEAGTTALTVGQVNFCDATAAYCTDIHLLGTAQLTSAGTAVMKFRPGIGSHSYKAVFLGATPYATSSSSSAALTVSGKYPTSTTIAQNGTFGSYSLTATVAGIVNMPGLDSPTGTVSFLDTTAGNAALGSAPLGTGTAGLSWFNSQTPLTGDDPSSIAVGDFNGDGVPDVAVANEGGVTVLLGNGDGTFTAAPSPVAGPSPRSIIVGDFNGDGVADLAVANDDLSNSLTILLGNGDGTFTAAPSPAAGIRPFALASADFNGDGIADLAVVGQDGDTLTVLLGNGDGTFTPKANSNAISGTYAIAVADFNGDGKADLAVSSGQTTAIAIFLGNGDGTFTQGATPTTSSYTYALTVGDFNGDGKADLALASVVPETTTVLLGNGDGTFTAAPQPASSGEAEWAIAAGDFNGDGIPDLAVANSYVNSATVLLTQLTQTATATVNGISLPSNSGTHYMAASYPGDSNFNSSLSGTTGLITTANLSLSTTSLSFGNEEVGYSTTSQNVTLTNTGGAALRISGVGLTGSNAASFVTSNTCGGNLAAGASCTIGVRFVPGVLGAANAAIALSSSLSATPQNIVTLGGSGINAGAAFLMLTADSLSFGSEPIGYSTDSQGVFVTNTSTAVLYFKTITLTGTDASSFVTSNTCGGSLGGFLIPGANCRIGVRFAPGAEGAASAAVTLTDNAPGSPQSISLSGTGVGNPVGSLSLSATSVAFDGEPVGESTDSQFVTVTNTSYPAVLYFKTITLGGANASSFITSNTCDGASGGGLGGSLSPFATCRIGLRFVPTTTGPLTASITLTDNATGSPQTITLTGTGQ